MKKFLLTIIAILLISAVSFGQTRKKTSPKTSRKTTLVQSILSGKNSLEGQMMPDFSAKTLDEKLVNSVELRGKVLVLNFWFVACKGCIEEMPKLNELAEKYKNDDVVFLGITFDKPELVTQFLNRISFKYQIIPDARTINKLFKVNVFPINAIIGKDGKIVYWGIGMPDFDKFDSVIKSKLVNQ